MSTRLLDAASRRGFSTRLEDVPFFIMDAPEDKDVNFQRDSSDLIKDLTETLPSLLYKSTTPNWQNVRRWMPAARTERFISLVRQCPPNFLPGSKLTKIYLCTAQPLPGMASAVGSASAKTITSVGSCFLDLLGQVPPRVYSSKDKD